MIIIGYFTQIAAVGILYLNMEKHRKVIIHLGLNFIGAICFGIGISLLPTLIFSRVHTYFGLIGFLLILVSLTLGIMQVKNPYSKTRKAHINVSRVSAGFLSIGLIIGVIIFL